MAKDFAALNLPPAPLRIQDDKVWDALRKKWVTLTPEEWVRQHFVHWMQTDRHYPPSLMANEQGLHINGTLKRCDTVVFGRDGKPLIIIEYKAADVPMTQDVFDQIVRYNMVLHARYLIVSNGMQHYCCKIDYTRNTYHFIRTVPTFDEVINPFSLS